MPYRETAVAHTALAFQQIRHLVGQATCRPSDLCYDANRQCYCCYGFQIRRWRHRL